MTDGEVITDTEAGAPLFPDAYAPGSTIGRYIVLHRLGAGGMGVVYAAYDPKLDRKIALKLVRAKAASGTGATQARAPHPRGAGDGAARAPERRHRLRRVGAR